MPRVSSAIFVGRADELEDLARALSDAAAGRSATRLIAGDAGIGKTRLVDEFVHRARAAESHVLVGACLQLGETGLPYAPFVGALRPLLRSCSPDQLDRIVGAGRGELAHLLPDLGSPVRRQAALPDASVRGPAQQARLFEVVLSVFRRLADERPLVLVLEDLHWADSSTRDLLRFLVRNATDARLLFVATYRSDELHRRHPLRPLVAELARLHNVVEIELGAFGESEVAALLAGITGEQATPELVAAVLARSGGNPFFAEELIASGEVGLALPRSLRETLVDRIRRLAPDTQQVVRVASVGGARVDHELLADVLDLPDPRFTEAVREAVEHHLLLPATPDETPAYGFRHALLQEAVYEELLPSERTRLHAAFARAIEASSRLHLEDPAGSSAQRAHHWLMAHDVERALPAVIAAGRVAAAATAFPEAQAFLERALELWPRVPPAALPAATDRLVILEEAAEAAAQAGDPRRSIDFVRAALAETSSTAEPMRTGTLYHRLAWYLNEAGDWQSGVTAMERAVELIPIDPPTPERARVLSDLAHSLMVRSRFGESLALGEAALAISRAVGARVAEARALNAIGLALACRSDFERGIPVLREGHALALELGDAQAVFLTAVGLGWALDESARHEEALTLANAARERLHDLGAEPRYGGQLASKASRALYELGRWDEADRLITETLESGPTRYAARWLLSNRIRLRAHRGQFELARTDLLAYQSLGERVVGPDPDLMAARRAELAIESGEPQTARQLVRDTLARLVEPELDSDGRFMMLTGLVAEADEVEAARAVGDRSRITAAIASTHELIERLRAHVARVREVAVRPALVTEADRLLGEALAGTIEGEPDRVAWDAAVDARRELGRPFELAFALAGAASASLALRQRHDVFAVLAEAHAITANLGAKPLQTRIEALARRGGVDLDGAGTVADAARQLGLTPREREVLALIAAGRTNRQIGEELSVAESTAGVHVSNILAKLGVSRRGEAAVIAHRLGLSGTL